MSIPDYKGFNSDSQTDAQTHTTYNHSEKLSAICLQRAIAGERITHNKNSSVAEMAAQSCTFSYEVPSTSLYLTSKHSFSVTSENISISHISPKTRFLGLHLRCRQCGSNFNHCDVIGPKATKFGEIKQNKGNYVVRSFKVTELAPMESSCATSYV